MEFIEGIALWAALMLGWHFAVVALAVVVAVLRHGIVVKD